ncbi:unnamed protein product [Nippostrongylus brasiliensis]|uniref:SERPIN domain-containing protein n=1 Tax=Nippostrongylus brasiliensis TaxID=27835 RepID=A0A0N4XI95_NIPBR|nr:unnamed protein product [Nippostrongylus brasiliensis]
MLFASLLAQNLIETDEAVRMYRETINSQQFICHDHFIQAAAHIGKEVEDMCGEFPKNGLVEVPPSIKSDILSYLRLYAVSLDGEAVLETDDATRFFYENLMRYYGKGGWQTRDASQNDLQTFEVRLGLTENLVYLRFPKYFIEYTLRNNFYSFEYSMIAHVGPRKTYLGWSKRVELP